MKAHGVMFVDVVAVKEHVIATETAARLVLEAFNGLPIINYNGMIIT
jgi:hypothetical protein